MSERVTLPESERPLPSGAVTGPLAGDGDISVSVFLRSDPATSPPVDVVAEAHKPPTQRRYLSAEEAADAYGASVADLNTVTAWAQAQGLTTTAVNQAARKLRLTGTAAALESAFGVTLHSASHHGASFRHHAGAVTLPADIAEVVEAVFGLDNRPLGRSFLRHAPAELNSEIVAWHRAGGADAKLNLPAGSFLPPQVATLYDFPGQSAAGQTVAIFAFNGPGTPGGYEAAVLAEYFKTDLKLAVPEITDVTVMGPGNSPGDGSNPDDASPEVYLDLSMVGSLATGAKIVVYFTEFTEQGWVEALSEAATDTVNHPSVISISYGNPENGSGTAWTAAAIKQVNQAFESASSEGKTITVAAGDSGATDGVSSGVHVDFPASSPWVLACGGTRLAGAGTHISSEVVWNDLSSSEGATGGGVSEVFALPSWQAHAKVPDNVSTKKPGRGVPDVSSLADPETPYIVAQPQGTGGVGGTSAAAPLWASLIARYNARPGASPIGFINPALYGLATNPLRDITSGNNRAAGGPGYAAGPGWDACTGWGSPGGSSLESALESTS